MLFTVITFFIVLSVLVLVHEWGHFITARRAGVKVEEFGLGLPPRAFGFFKNISGRWELVGLKTKEAPKTIWSLNWLPLGGFVKIKGEDGGDPNDTTSFASKGVLNRIWIISAGVTMNVLLAIVLLSIGLAIGSPQVVDSTKISKWAEVSDIQVRVTEVLKDSPAARAGIESPDAIISVAGQTVTSIDELQMSFEGKVGQEIEVVLERNGETITTKLVPEILAETEKAGMGVAMVQTGFISYPWYIAPVFGVVETFKMIAAILVGFFVIIKTLIMQGELIGEVYGPVGIANLVGDAARLGFLYVMQFTAILSIIIAVINFLPFPALDGGRVVFLIIEGLRGKPVNPKIENTMHNIGFALLMLLILVVTYNDIARVSTGLLDWSAKLF